MEQHNYFGGSLFWLYIIAALAFTGIVLDTITRPEKPGLPPRAKHQTHVAIFGILAIISFSTLSFNMLHVLISSYQFWSHNRHPSQPILSTLSLFTVWNWSIGSTLFQDFGNAIVEDEARYLWTQTALLGTFSVCLFMASEGLQRSIPRLWAFFALSQILPISFAQNLFYIATLRTTSRIPNVSFPQNRTLRVIAAYCICLAIAPYTAKSKYLIPTILAARILLLMPLLLASAPGKPTKLERPFGNLWAQRVLMTLALALSLKQGYAIFHSAFSAHDVLLALLSHPAVTTLGMDALLCVLSFGVWIALDGSTQDDGQKAE